MESNFQVSGTCLTVYLPAEVDHYHTEGMKEEADRILQERNISCIIFDFDRTSFMDSSGIGMIMGRYKNMRFMGGVVMAVHVNERIRRILAMSGISKLIEIH